MLIWNSYRVNEMSEDKTKRAKICLNFEKGAANYNIPKGYLIKGKKKQYFSLPCAEKRNEYFALLDWFVVACKWYLQRTPQDPRSVKETL